MNAFMIATVTIKDAEKFQEYAVKSKVTLDLFGAEVVTKGQYQGTLIGKVDHQAVAIVKFKDIETLNTWYMSDEYQALISLRDQAAEITMTQYTIPVA